MTLIIPAGKSQTRGVRLCNPFNIKEFRNSPSWKGERSTEDDPIMEEFETPEYGIRAGTILFRNYQRIYGRLTPSEMITRFAPQIENPTDAYIDNVCKWIDWREDVAFILNSEDRCIAWANAIMRQENGYIPYDDDTIRRGVRMALGLEV